MSNQRFVIDEFENIEIDIPDGKGGVVTLTVPPLDCLKVEDVEQVNKKLEELEFITPNDFVKTLLKHYNKTKKEQDAIDNLVTRQITLIDRQWKEYNEVDLGEFSDSADE